MGINNRREHERLLFCVVILLHLIPIWTFKYFPSQDGPVHIENASIIKEYANPNCSIFREYYVFNKKFTPTWIGHLLLTGLIYLFSPLVGEKILLSAYVILLPLSVRFALSSVRPDTRYIAYLCFPFIYNYYLHMGFYSFSYSLFLFFFLVGYWIKHREHFTPLRIVKLAALSMLVFSFHVFTLAMAYIFIALLTIGFILFDLKKKNTSAAPNPNIFLKTIIKRVLPVLCAVLPTLIFLIMFLNTRSLGLNWKTSKREIFYRLFDLIQIEPLVSYQKMEVWISLALGLVFWALFLYFAASKLICRRFDHWDGLIVIACVYSFMFLIFPNVLFDFGEVTARLNIFPFFTLLIWFGAQLYSRILKKLIIPLAIGIAITSLSFHTIKYAELNYYPSLTLVK